MKENKLSHGLSNNEALNYERIIRSCFTNPDRKNFPDFSKKYGSGIKIYQENEFPEYWINKLKIKLVNSFNSEKISLHETGRLKDQSSQNVSLYLSTLNRSRWYGPYKHREFECFYFLAIDELGKDEYYVVLRLDVSHQNEETIEVRFLKNNIEIAPHYCIQL